MEAVPSLLTVEEAARVLRVGRTKAYAMAQEWRATGGRSGLPVVDFGNVLRVPRCQLEALLGGPLTSTGPTDPAAAERAAPTDGPDAPAEQPAHGRAPDTNTPAHTNGPAPVDHDAGRTSLRRTSRPSSTHCRTDSPCSRPLFSDDKKEQALATSFGGGRDAPSRRRQRSPSIAAVRSWRTDQQLPHRCTCDARWR